MSEQESFPVALEVEHELWVGMRRLGGSKETGIRRLMSSGTEAVSSTGDLEAAAEQLRQWSRAPHTSAEARVVILTAPHLLDERHHVLGAVRIVRR